MRTRRKNRRKKIFTGVFLILIITVGAAWIAAPGIVEREIKDRAEKAGLQVSVGSVQIRPFRITLMNVIVRSRKFPGQQVIVEQTEVLMNSSLEVEEVRGTGGSVSLSGPWEDLRDRYLEWRQPVSKGGGPGGKRKKLSVSGLSLKWSGLTDKAELEMDGVSLSRDDGIRATAESLNLRRGTSYLNVVKAEWDGDSTVKAGGVEIRAGGPGKTKTRNKVGGGMKLILESVPGQMNLSVSSLKMTLGGRELEATKAVLSFRKKESIWLTMKVDSTKSPVAKSGQASASVRIDTTEGRTTADIMVDAKRVGTSHPALAKEEIETGRFRFDGTVYLFDGQIEVENASFGVGEVRVRVSGSKSQDRILGRVLLKPTPCQKVINSVPKSMTRTVDGMRMGGSISFDIQFDVDLPDRKHPSVTMALKNRCVVESVPERLKTSRFKKVFQYEMYSRGKEIRSRTTGPGSGGWVPLQLVSRFVPVSVRTMEDPGFWAHHGFHVEAIENSIKENIRTGRFVRGASTISMQLAKNLWLQRERTAARKIQEAFLTMWLEQSLTKEQILELYINVVEFGPDVYGLKDGAHHYFRTHPTNLSLGQSLFLASILPRPNSHYFGPDGKLFPGKAGNLRRIMKTMKEKQRISEDEYQDGITEVLSFRSPSTKEPMADEDIPTSSDGIDPGSWD